MNPTTFEGSNGKWKRVPKSEVLPMKTALHRVALGRIPVSGA